tara:strand:- start:82 stop:1617 length:1536 start_codon:yes stop_codon:yes gene_type:complete
MSLHDNESRIAADAILNKWRSGDPDWMNPFVDSDIAYTSSSQIFPSPDQSFFSLNKFTRLAMEFKPAFRESKRGLLTGLGQALAYLTTKIDGKLVNDASILVIPEKIDGFPIGDFLEELFKSLLVDKIPIGLVTFKENDPASVKLRCNLSSSFKTNYEASYEKALIKVNDPEKAAQFAKTEIGLKNKGGGKTYWSYWREAYPDNIFHFLKKAFDNPTFSKDKIYEMYYYDCYCYPPNTVKDLNPIKNGMHTWDEPQIWSKTLKRSLKRDVKLGKITLDQALLRLEFESSNSQKRKNEILAKIKNNPSTPKNKSPTDGNFVGIRKNLANTMKHLGLWDGETYKVTNRGEIFLSRIEEGNDPIEELGVLLFGAGKWDELILDITGFQDKIEVPEKREDFDKLLKDEFLSKGFISVNPERRSSGARNLLQSEYQVWGRLKIRRGFKAYQGYSFDEDRIRRFKDTYHEYYKEDTYDYENIENRNDRQISSRNLLMKIENLDVEKRQELEQFLEYL